MENYFIKFFWAIFLVSGLLFLVSARAVLALTPLELDIALKERAGKLQEIHQKLQETQQNLFEVEGQKRTLGQELNRMAKDVKQLNLGIQSSAINIEKLTLEMESLQYDIDKIQNAITLKKDALRRLIRKLQETDQETFVMQFLKNRTLSANFAEASGYSAINSKISQGIGGLKLLQEEFNDKLGQTTTKKSLVEKEKKNLQTKKTIVLDKEQERKQLLAQTKNQEKIYQQQISELEQQQLKIAEEIEEIEAKLRAQTDPNSLPSAIHGVLGVPIAGGRVSQGWGHTRFARYGYKGGWHNGLDFAGPLGTPILAAEDGVVLGLGDQDKYCRKGAYGKYIVIKHHNNLVTLYAHLSRFAAAVGDIVKRGDVVGYMGSTGYSTGSHVHFTVYDGKTYGMRSSTSCGLMPSGGDLNPALYL